MRYISEVSFGAQYENPEIPSSIRMVFTERPEVLYFKKDWFTGEATKIDRVEFNKWLSSGKFTHDGTTQSK